MSQGGPNEILGTCGKNPRANSLVFLLMNLYMNF